MSKLHWSLCAAVALLVVAAGTVEAQQPGGRGRGRGRGAGGFGNPAMMRMMLLNNEKVQKELELVDDQKTELKKIADELRPAGGQRPNFQNLSDDERQKLRTEGEAKMKEAQAKVDKVLLPQQQERLKQISWQLAGAAALSDPEVAEKLKLSDKQKEDIKAAEGDGSNVRDIYAKVRSGELTQEQARAKGDEMRKATEEKTLAVLTPEQKTEFEKLKGDKASISREDLFGGAGGGRRNRGGAAPANP